MPNEIEQLSALLAEGNISSQPIRIQLDIHGCAEYGRWRLPNKDILSVRPAWAGGLEIAFWHKNVFRDLNGEQGVILCGNAEGALEVIKTYLNKYKEGA